MDGEPTFGGAGAGRRAARCGPELREAAVGMRAVANQAFLTAATTMGISERLAAWADVSSIVFPRPDTWAEPEREGD